MLMTRDSSWRLDRTVQSLRGKYDELVIGVDDRSSDDTLSRAERLGARVLRVHNPQGYIEPHIETLFHACTQDFVLRLDDDELLSTHFDLGAIPAPVLEAQELFGFPRAWIAQRDPALYFGSGAEEELVPQYRLMKRRASWRFVSRIHTPGFEMKPAHVLDDVFLFHLNLVDRPAAARQAQHAFYESVRPAPWNQTYLLDPAQLAHSSRARPCEAAMRAPLELLRSGPDDFPLARGGDR